MRTQDTFLHMSNCVAHAKTAAIFILAGMEITAVLYDKIEDTESLLIEARAKKTAIEAEKLTADNIYKVLI